MRILLAIANADLRLSIEILLSQEPSVHVVGVASEAVGLQALLDSTQLDMVILDIELTGQPAADLKSLIQDYKPEIPFFVLGREPDQREPVKEAGAIAFVVAGEPPEMLLQAFRQARAHLGSLADDISVTP